MREQRSIEKLVVDADTRLQSPEVHFAKSLPPSAGDLRWDRGIDQGDVVGMPSKLVDPAKSVEGGRAIDDPPSSVRLDSLGGIPSPIWCGLKTSLMIAASNVSNCPFATKFMKVRRTFRIIALGVDRILERDRDHLSAG